MPSFRARNVNSVLLLRFSLDLNDMPSGLRVGQPQEQEPHSVEADLQRVPLARVDLPKPPVRVRRGSAGVAAAGGVLAEERPRRWCARRRRRHRRGRRCWPRRRRAPVLLMEGLAAKGPGAAAAFLGCDGRGAVPGGRRAGRRGAPAPRTSVAREDVASRRGGPDWKG